MRRDDLAVGAFALFGEPFDEAGGIGDFALGFGQALALFAGQQAAQGVLLAHHQIEPAAQDAGAFARRLRGPGLHRGLGGGDGAEGLRGAHVGDGRQHLACGRVGYFDGSAAVGVDPAAVDIGLMTQQAGGIGHGAAPWSRSGSRHNAPERARLQEDETSS